MKIDPSLLAEFKDWMRGYLAAQLPGPIVVPIADLAEVRGFIQMMKTEQWRVIGEAADRSGPDLTEFQEDDLMRLDDYERPYYEEFLRSRSMR